MKILLVVVPDHVDLPAVEGALACVARPLPGNPGPAQLQEAMHEVAQHVGRLLASGYSPSSPVG